MNLDEEITRIKSEEDPIKKSHLIYSVYKNKDLKLRAVAEALSTSIISVCNLLRIRKLPDIVIDGYYSQTISLTHLFIISRLKTTEDMVALYEQVLGQSLTTAQTEAAVREKLYNLKAEGDHLSKEEKEKLRTFYKSFDPNIDVTIIQTRIRAKIILSVKGNLKETKKVLMKLIGD